MSDPAIKKIPKPNYFTSLFTCHCPRCRTGKMFNNGISISGKTNMAMPGKCPVCGQPMELEVGFYYGTGYVSYALTVAISVATFLAFWVIYGISIDDNSLYIWLVLNIIVLILGLPYIMRLSRTLWLSFFVKFDPNWQSKEPPKPERIVKEHMNNW
ncbi:hypothetical protein BH10BAC3_BH10BAC3_20280 [soil metagenome]